MVRLTIENAWIEFPMALARRTGARVSRTGGAIDAERGVVTALRDISFDLGEGDRLGLIGHNGAGKTTMLRMLAGAYAPTRGSVVSVGRVGALFNTTPGLNMEGTGRENLVTCGLHLGMSRRQIEAKMDEIIDFADLGDYIDLPVRIYSAGMMTRLGFSVATASAPEILLLDEGLATGDAQFAQKAERKMSELIARSSILVIASHSETLLTGICNRGILLEHGRILAQGPAKELIESYRASVIEAAQQNDEDGLHRAYVLATNMVRRGQAPPLQLEEQSLRYALRLHPDDGMMLQRFTDVLKMQGKSIPFETEARLLLVQLEADPARSELEDRLRSVVVAHSSDIAPDLRERAAQVLGKHAVLRGQESHGPAGSEGEAGVQSPMLENGAKGEFLSSCVSAIAAKRDDTKLDVDALLAQIAMGVAEEAVIMTAVSELMQSSRPVPLPLEAAALRIHIAADASRVDLKKRLASVQHMLGQEMDKALLAEVEAAMLSTEHATDFQALLDEYGKKVRFADVEPEFLELVAKVRRFTMTTMERLYALWSSVGYICDRRIEGDFVECGVWRGGSVMMMALELLRRNACDRELWLYDTFSGLPRPDPNVDIDVLGNRAIDGWQAQTIGNDKTIWAYADEADVRRNMVSTGYPADQLRFIKGMVEETIPGTAPGRIALLRVDTDWYGSYKHILHEFYDRVTPGGAVIFDDYGHFLGAKKAVDEFRTARRIVAPLIRIDYSCRMMFKPA